MKNKNKFGMIVASSVIMSYLLVGGVVLAAGPAFGRGGMMGGRAPGIIGTVSAISGTTLTVTNKSFGQNTTPVTYAVDASSATVSKNGATSSLSNVSVGDTVMIVGTVSSTNVAATTIRDGMGQGMGRGNMMNRGVAGTVASVNGSSFTVTSKMGPNANGSTATTYTVDASKATVNKNGTASSVANITVGDTVMVQGTVSGTSVVATVVRDGMPQGQKVPEKKGTPATAIMSAIKGNGQPVVGGSVTAINGSVLTVTNKSNVTYTIDASSATINKANATTTLSSVSVGDNVIVQGAVNGTSVTASSVIDQGATPANTPAQHKGVIGSVLGSIGGFFQHLFGF